MRSTAPNLRSPQSFLARDVQLSHEFVTKMKAKFKEVTLKWMAAEKEVCPVHVGHRCFIKSYQCSQPTLTVPFAMILCMTPSSRLALTSSVADASVSSFRV